MPGGVFRLAVPDYGAPVLAECLRLGHDPNNTWHLVLPTYDSVMPMLVEGPWRHVVAIERWQGGRFYSTNIQEAGEGGGAGPAVSGHVKRTPAHAPMWLSSVGEQYLPGPDGVLRETSLVFDLVK